MILKATNIQLQRERLLTAVLFSLAAVQIYSLFLQQALAVLAIVSVGVYLLSPLAWRQWETRVRRIFLLMLIFLVFRIAGAVYDLGDRAAINLIQFPLLALVFFAFAAAPRAIGDQGFEKLSRIWIYAAVLACVISIGKYLVGWESRIGPPFGATITRGDGIPEGNYSTLAKFLTFTLCFFGPLLLRKQTARLTSISLIGLGLMFAGLFLTFSRSCWLAVSVVYLYLLLKIRRELALAAALLGIALIILVPFARTRVAQSLDPAAWSSGRVELWSVAAQHATERPLFGHGLGSFRGMVTPEVRKTLPDPGVGDWHNQYIQLYMESGLLGLVLFLSIVVLLYLLFSKPVSQGISEPATLIQSGGKCLILGLMITGMFEQSLSSPSANITLWCLFGLAVGWSQLKAEDGA